MCLSFTFNSFRSDSDDSDVIDDGDDWDDSDDSNDTSDSIIIDNSCDGRVILIFTNHGNKRHQKLCRQKGTHK